MSTATLERVALTEEAASWGPWIIGSNGGGQRNCFVLRYRDTDNHNSPAEYHVNAKGDAIKYTMAGAEKKAHELNREVADAKRRDAFLAKREAERQEQQVMAQEVRDVAQCGTLNSEMIARWIISNFTANDEVQELREERDEALAAAESAAGSVEWAEGHLVKVEKRCNSLAEEARILLAELGAFGPPVFTDPLEFAAGSTPLEKVLDMSRNLVAALEAYEQES
jgi:hypothetical protein